MTTASHSREEKRDIREFVLRFKDERDSMLASYLAPEPTTFVGKLLREADLDGGKRESVAAALDQALTDAFYTILPGLDGSASIGGVQQSYRIHNDAGAVISHGNGDFEAVAFEVFQDS